MTPRTQEDLEQDHREHLEDQIVGTPDHEDPDEHEPDYGGVFDGNTVTSDADPGL